jgi:penicillin-binding protein 1A
MGKSLGLELKPYYSMALGSIETTPLQLTSAYQAFANLGIRCKPYFIVKIVSLDGRVLEENNPQCEQVLPPQETRVLVDMLRAVVLEGTGASASSIDRFVAGKTGTTNDYMDAWFVGFAPQIVAGVWVGFDLKRSMGKGMAFVAGTEEVCSQGQERQEQEKPKDELEGIVEPEFLPQQPKIKELP